MQWAKEPFRESSVGPDERGNHFPTAVASFSSPLDENVRERLYNRVLVQSLLLIPLEPRPLIHNYALNVKENH